VFITTVHTEHTYETAFEIAKKFGSEITFIKYIIKPAPKYGFFETKGEKKQHEKKLSEAEETLNHLEELAKKENLSVLSKVSSTESFAEDLISYIESNKVDLIIVDSHSLDEAEEFEHKDLIHKIFKNISCPFLTLK
jgi:nucleotide-binding universal stress UspA family protein